MPVIHVQGRISGDRVGGSPRNSSIFHDFHTCTDAVCEYVFLSRFSVLAVVSSHPGRHEVQMHHCTDLLKDDEEIVSAPKTKSSPRFCTCVALISSLAGSRRERDFQTGQEIDIKSHKRSTFGGKAVCCLDSSFP